MSKQLQGLVIVKSTLHRVRLEPSLFDGTRAAVELHAIRRHLDVAWTRTELLLSDGLTNYIYGPGGLPVEQVSAGGTATYYHHDQLGSTRMLTDSSGNATGTFSYAPYGALSGSTGSQTTPLGYAGQYTDPESGLQYLRARYYAPSTGQFVSRDPLNTLTRSPYGYANDNPLTGTDPTGLDFLSDAWNTATDVVQSLNPVKYYEDEVNAWQSGCSYWSSVSHGLQGAGVLVADAPGVAGLAEGGAALLGREDANLIEDVLAGLAAGRSGGVYTVDNPEQLQAIYDELAARGTPIAEPSTYPGDEVILSDGTRVGLRSTSRTGGPTIDIMQNGNRIRIHVAP